MISDECCCGSKFKVSSNSGWAAGSEEKYAHQFWTDKHQVCRENKIISLQENIKELINDRQLLLDKLVSVCGNQTNAVLQGDELRIPSDNGSDT